MSEPKAQYNETLPAERAMVFEVSGTTVRLTPEIIRRYLVAGDRDLVTDQEIVYFMHICRSRGLNPFNKDCYLIKYSKEPAAIVVSIDKMRLQARRSADCRGWKCGVIVQGKDGQLRYSRGLVLEGEKLLGGWFEGKPSGWDEPFILEINLSGYIKKTHDGKITRFWSPDNQPSMISKVAEAQGLRRLWPEMTQGLTTSEEIESQVIDVSPGREPKIDVDEIVEFSPEITSSLPDAEIDSPNFKTFMAMTAAANRTTEIDVIKSANRNPSGFVLAYDAYLNKRTSNGHTEAPVKRTRKRAAASPEPPAGDPPGPVPASAPDLTNGAQPAPEPPAGDPPGPVPASAPNPANGTQPAEDKGQAILSEIRAEISTIAAQTPGYVYQAQRNLGFSIGRANLPPTVDGCLRLMEEIRNVQKSAKIPG